MSPFRRGIIVADIMMGLALLAATAVVLAVAMSREQLAAARLADAREATRIGETVLIHLQTNLPAPQQDPQTQVVIRDCDGAGLPGHHWVDVTVSVRGRSRSVAGLVTGKGATPAGDGK